MNKLIIAIVLLLGSCAPKQEKNESDLPASANNVTENFDDLFPKIDSVVQPMNATDDSVMKSFITIASMQDSSVLGDGNGPLISDVSTIQNINRPSRSYIKSSKYDLNNLFGVWGRTNEPVSDFRIDAKIFDAADYEGNGSMPYMLYQDSLIVFYNDFIRNGKILYSTKDSLVIKWKYEGPEDKYSRWR